MEESPRFKEAKDAWEEFNIEDLIAERNTEHNFKELENLLININTAANAYFTNQEYRKTLTRSQRDQVDTHLVNITNVAKEAINERNTNPPNFTANRNSHRDRIHAEVDQLQTPLISTCSAFIGSLRPEENIKKLDESLAKADAIVQAIEEINKSAESVLSSARGSREQAEKEAQKAAEAAGLKANTTMQAYFLSLVQPSRSSSANERARAKDTNPTKNRTFFIYGHPITINNIRERSRALLSTILLACLIWLAWILYTETISLEPFATWFLIGLAAPLLVYVSYKQLISSSSRLWQLLDNAEYFFAGYKGSARAWFVLVILSIFITFLASYFLFGDLRHVEINQLTFESISVRAVVLLAPAYLIRFSVRNYNASKHLSVINTHRAQVAGILNAYIAMVSGADGDRKKEILMIAAQLLFDPGESGYITRRDGAGTSDNFFSGQTGGINRPTGSAD